MRPIFLKNRIPVFFLPTAGTEAVTVLVLVKVGSRYETPVLSGASHFIEHMMFKGTKKRPKAEMISRELDGVGAEYNAFTGKDVTGYWVKVDAKHLPLAVDLLHDMLSASHFRAAELDRERGVIIEEINMYHDNPMMHVEEMLEAVMFAGSTLGREIAGTHETMRAMPRAELLAYRDRLYDPSRMVIAVAGAVPRSARALLASSFGSLGRAKQEAPTFTPFLGFSARGVLHRRIRLRRRSAFGGVPTPRVMIQKKTTQQIQLALGWPGVSYADERLPAVRLLSVILGGPMSSRLFSSVREKRGLCYFIRSSVSPFEDTGLFQIQSGLDRSRLPLAAKIIMGEIARIRRTRVGADELRRAKDYISGKTVLGLEDSAERAEWYAKQHLYLGAARTPEEQLARIGRVTAAEVQAAARELLDPKRMGISAIGPFKNEKEILRLFV